MKIVFMGTPDFAQESLKELYQAGHEIVAVVTNPDRPKGRGMKMIPTPVKEYAQEKNLVVYQPEKVKKNAEFIQEIQKLKPDVICVVAYGKILPKTILEIPQLGCINVHASLLPAYRGAAPIQWAILNGDKTTGVTTMYMDIGMDTGDIILKEEVEIGEEETTGELWERLSKIGGKLLVETLTQIEQGKAPRIKQPENFTMAPMLEKQMAKIDWQNQTAQEIKNLVRGLNPIMGAYTFYEGKKIKLWKVRVLQEEEIGEILKENKELSNGEIVLSNSKQGLYIKAKQGMIQVLEIQGENAKRMQIQAFLLGNQLEEGKKLE